MYCIYQIYDCVCLAILLLLSVLLFVLSLLLVIWSVSSLQVYDHLTLLNIDGSLEKLSICGSDGHSKSLLPFLPSKPPHLQISPTKVVSSANFRSLTEGYRETDSLVYRENRRGDRTQLCGEPVLVDLVLGMILPSFTRCDPLVKKSGKLVLQDGSALLKSTNKSLV